MSRLLPALLLAAAIIVAGGAVADTPGDAASTTQPQTSPAEIWERASPAIDLILNERAETRFAPVGPSDSAPARRLAQMLDKAVDLLAVTDTENVRQRLRDAHAAIREKEKKIAGYRFSMASAPEGDDNPLRTAIKDYLGIAPMTLTKGDYRRLIAGVEEEIRGLQDEIAGAKREFADGLRKIGVNLTDQQVEGLMSMVTGDDLVTMQAAFENMKAINQELLQATIRTDESLEVARRYYGIYAVMLEIAQYMHEDFIAKVDGSYLKKLGEIEERTRKLRGETAGLVRAERDPHLKKVLESNVAAQDLTLRAAQVYRQRLLEQKAKVQQSLSAVNRQLQVAVNTYRTVENSHDLVQLMRSTGKQFDQLMKLEIPTLRPFESIEMQNEFNRLSEELRGTPTS